MKLLFVTMAMSTLFLIGTAGPVAFAQETQKEAAKPKADGSTLRGCLQKSTAEGSYTLTDSKGNKTPVTGTAELGKHVGHTVELTGSKTNAEFRATAIKHISATCEEPPAEK